MTFIDLALRLMKIESIWQNLKKPRVTASEDKVPRGELLREQVILSLLRTIVSSVETECSVLRLQLSMSEPTMSLHWKMTNCKQQGDWKFSLSAWLKHRSFLAPSTINIGQQRCNNDIISCRSQTTKSAESMLIDLTSIPDLSNDPCSCSAARSVYGLSSASYPACNGHAR